MYCEKMKSTYTFLIVKQISFLSTTFERAPFSLNHRDGAGISVIKKSLSQSG